MARSQNCQGALNCGVYRSSRMLTPTGLARGNPHRCIPAMHELSLPPFACPSNQRHSERKEWWLSTTSVAQKFLSHRPAPSIAVLSDLRPWYPYRHRHRHPSDIGMERDNQQIQLKRGRTSYSFCFGLKALDKSTTKPSNFFFYTIPVLEQFIASYQYNISA
jgi:hypothetical protein